MNEILAERDGDVLVLTLNRPQKANAMNEAMQLQLTAGLEQAGRDDAVRAVVLAAAGNRVFSAGADLKEFAELERAAAARRRRALLVRTLTAAIDFGKPLVAAVQAQALGAACMLALLADEVIMADSARLGMPEIKHGMPSPVGLAIIAARGGAAIARTMVQGGEPIDARQAVDRGLADRIVDPASLPATSLARARALPAGFAFEANKKFLHRELRAALLAAAAEAERLQPA